MKRLRSRTATGWSTSARLQSSSQDAGNPSTGGRERAALAHTQFVSLFELAGPHQATYPWAFTTGRQDALQAPALQT